MDHPPLPRWRPWLPVLIYTSLVYATLPLTPWIVTRLDKIIGHSEVNLLFNVFLMAMVVGVILLLRNKTWGQRVAILLPVGVVSMLALWIDKATERGHIPIYALLGGLTCRAFMRQRSATLPPFLIWLWPTLITACIGVGDELIQRVLPNRYFDMKDMVVNAISGALGVWLWRMFFHSEARSSTTSSSST